MASSLEFRRVAGEIFRTLVLPIGHKGENGLVLVASSDLLFPSPENRALMRTFINQTALRLRDAQIV